jgi:hypothetical protein
VKLAILLSLGLTFSTVSAGRAETLENAPGLYAALIATLDQATHRQTPRVEQATIDPSGDTTVVFAIRDLGDEPAAIRNGAIGDTLDVLRAVYASPDAGRIRVLTILGTFPFQGTKSKSPRETPVLRAVVSAERASSIDFSSLTAEDLGTALDGWWMQGAFAAVGDTVPPDPSTDEPSSTDDAELGAIGNRIDVALAHVDEALFSLSAGDIGVVRSQFKQFFDTWDEIDKPISQLYPSQYAGFDAALESAEVALLHTQPEDLATAQNALRDLRVDLSEIRRDIDLRLESSRR